MNEQNINEILDKIIEKGIDSLSENDFFILNNNGKLPNNKIILSDDIEEIRKNDIIFSYDLVSILKIDEVSSGFVKEISNFLNDNYYIIEIHAEIKTNSKSYYSTYYVTVDKYDDSDENLDWDCDLFNNYPELLKHEKTIDSKIIDIINKSL